MAIEKFKFGQEITSAKLNEIVTFLNTLETLYYNTKSWNDNVDSKVLAFQNKLDGLRQEVNSLLETAVPLQTLTSTFLSLKAAYESLVAEDVNAFLTTIFTDPNTVTVDPVTNEILVGGVTTGVSIEDFTTIVGPKGDPGLPGAAGVDGVNGTKFTISVNDTPGTPGESVIGDIHLKSTTGTLRRLEASGWVYVGTVKGNTGATGEQGATTLIQFRYRNEENGPVFTSPSDATKFIEFKTYLNTDTSEQIEQKPWIKLRIRGDEYFPQIKTLETGEVILQWSKDGPLEIPSINIRGPQGPKGEKGLKGDSGETFTILGIYATLVALETAVPTGTEGDAYAVGNAVDGYEIYIWDTVAAPAEWNSIGSLQQPILEGFSPTFNATVTTLSPGSNATVSLTYDPVDEEYDFAFGLPRGDTGTRGSRIFLIDEGEVEPTIASWDGIDLLIGDTFININNGEIKRVAQLSPSFVLELVYQLPFENRLAYRVKALESINKGDLVQYVDVQGGHKLVAKASQTSRVIGSYTAQSCNDYPELIMGFAEENVSANSFFDVIDWGQIINADEFNSYIDGFPEGSVMYFDAAGTTPGRITNIEPTGNTQARLVVAAWLGGPQDVLQIRLGHAVKVADVKGLQTALDGKAASSHTHGNITNAGAIGSTSGLAVVTTTSGVLTTESKFTTLFSNAPQTISTSTNTDITLSETISLNTRLRITWSNTSGMAPPLRTEFSISNLSGGGSGIRIAQHIFGPGSFNFISVNAQLGTTTSATSSNIIRLSNPRLVSDAGSTTSVNLYYTTIERVNF